MALQGTLKDFSVADIFQLIAQQGKSGTLILIADEAETQIVFDKGNVVLARFTKGHEEIRLGSMLQRAGDINKEQLAMALDEHERQMKSLGDVLIAKNYIAKDTLSSFLQLQTRETLFLILQWKNGAYKFKTEDFNYNKQLIKPLSSDYLLMDGVRQIDEWPQLQKIVGSMQNTYEVTAEGKSTLAQESTPLDNAQVDPDIDNAFAEFDKQQTSTPAKSAINENERVILQLVKPENNLQTIIDKSRLGTFESVSGLAQLINKKLVVILIASAASSQAVPASNNKYSINTMGYSLFQIGILALLSLFGAALLSLVKPVIMNHTNSFGVSEADLLRATIMTQYQSRTQEQRLHQALSIYYIENLDYPNDLNQLALKGILPAEEIKRSQTLQFMYNKNISGYILLPPPKSYEPER